MPAKRGDPLIQFRTSPEVKRAFDKLVEDSGLTNQEFCEWKLLHPLKLASLPDKVELMLLRGGAAPAPARTVAKKKKAAVRSR
jgi:hypothetical protein